MNKPDLTLVVAFIDLRVNELVIEIDGCRIVPGIGKKYS